MQRSICTLGALAILLLPAGRSRAAEPEVWFEATFDGKLDPGWEWLAQQDGAWRIKDGALELRVLPQQETILAHALPNPQDGPFAIEMTVTSDPQPTNQYEQVGLFWYADGKPAFKFVKERIDGELYVFPGKKPMPQATVSLRLVVEGDAFVAHYLPGGEGEPQEAFRAATPPSANGKHQIAVSCFHGPTDTEHWVRISQFRIVKLPAK